MSCSSSNNMSPTDALCIFPERYYYFRCEVKNSLQQVWKVNDVEMIRLGPTSRNSDFFPTEPLNFLVQEVITGDSPFQTSYVSYLWFNSSNYNITSIACENIAFTLATIGESLHY